MKLTEIENANNLKEGYSTSILKQLYLIKAELLSLRLDWKWSLLIILVTPLSMLIFLTFLFKDNKAYLLYVITGNMVMSLVTGTMLTLGQELGLLKEIRGFDYYALLPLRKISLIIAYISRATILTIPSMGVIYLVGKFIVNIDITFNLSIIVVVVLSGFSLSALGAFIGVYSRDAGQASILTQVIQPLIIYLAPVFIPMSSMPKYINYISYLIPTRYAAQALRASCVGLFDTKSILVLTLFSILSVVLIEKKMDWRRG